MRILIVFGSTRGGTEGIARVIGETLVSWGHQVDVQPAQKVNSLAAWDAILVGGGIYAGRLQKHARRFVTRHLDELQTMPVWFFSSGPLDDSASKGDLAPTPSMRRLINLVHARGHHTFGGRLEGEAKGFIARTLVKQGKAGDWRDMDAVRTWSGTIAGELAVISPRRGVAFRKGSLWQRPVRRLLLALCFFTGVTAILGGIEMLVWPMGAPWMKFSISVLKYSPFHTFLIPGLCLLLGVGLSNLLSCILVIRRHPWSEAVAFGAGSAITVWSITEMVWVYPFSWLEGLYLGIGILTMAAALWLWLRRMQPSIKDHRNKEMKVLL